MNVSLRKVLGLILGLALAPLAPVALAQGYPVKPIRMVLPYASGGASDAIARRVAQALGTRLGQPVVVESKGGAATALGVQAVASAPADGYTILFTSATSFAINPHVYRNLPYRPQDFLHLGMIVETPLLMVGSSSVGASTVAELVAQHRSEKDAPIVATNGKSGFSHLTAAMFYTSQSLPFIDAPYKGEGAVLPDLVSGQVKYFFGTVPGLMPHVEGGRLKAFAVTSSERSPKAPQVPTFQELGYPVQATAWFGLAVHRNTPREAVDRLAEALGWAMDQQDLRERLAADGSIPKKLTPQAMEAYVKDDSAKWSRLVDRIQAGGLELR